MIVEIKGFILAIVLALMLIALAGLLGKAASYFFSRNKGIK